MDGNSWIEKASNQTFNFDLILPLDRLEQVLNNEFFSDVVFKVGSTGQLMYAHKLILTLASEVFHAQFTRGFAESNQNNREHPIVIDDIEPDVFTEVLRYIYCGKIDLDEDNMLDVYYASQKYLLKALTGICEDMFLKTINEENVLAVAIDNERYGFTAVEELCLKFIRDNPLNYFRQKDFLALGQRTMELIASAETMNCQIDHLRKAIAQWQISSGEKVSTPKFTGLQCRKLALYGPFHYVKDINTELTVSVRKPVALYGIGVFVGVRPMPDSSNSLNITVNIDSHICASTNLVPLKRDLWVHEIMFKKQLIVDESCIKVTVRQQWHIMKNEFFCLKQCSAVDKLNDVDLRITDKRDEKCCIAYLLFNEE